MISPHDAVPYVRLCMVYATVLAAHVAFTPPARPQKNAGKKRDSITRASAWHPVVMKSVLWILALCESCFTLAATTHLHPLLRDVLGLSSTLHPTLAPAFVVGVALVALGGAGRAACYRALGRHFTFELTLQDGHRLVTDGPYAVVRHPSYAAIVPVVLGLPLALLGPGSWAQTSGALHTPAGALAAAAWVLNLAWLPAALVARVGMEDDMLRREFGPEWTEWAHRTPYKLVPGVY
ncbi:hypothetical protein PHLGIDRAFT_191717 [Phlebiopsis gigantea 11061_1 CR5-6]|uniref:Protein-S-isoprenylcysteine O-methyltransferase n=1 Tax=Phlebiopsis gigantea (strain 11061_1 CR5-6) TaxID=745531 RepID=A0A0C3PFV5_PHLG1|nr:hypothetical protein PHLGIDRAFT_191717 [Phlebiopsis gigantea 11061_1 CR5-6]